MKYRLLLIVVIATALLAHAATPDPQQQIAQPSSLDAVIDRVIQTEAHFNQSVRQFSPIVETYIQNLRTDKDLGEAPRSDQYFLGRLDLSGPQRENTSMLEQPTFMHRMLTALPRQFQLTFKSMGFGDMIYIDPRGLDRAHYDFELVGREFLGDLRCIVIDVRPMPKSGPGRFLGRIWVEDRGFNVVRFTGVFAPQAHGESYFLHFDSWRLNMQPGLWLPAYIYTEESDKHYGLDGTMHFKAQTRFWGYDLRNPAREQELAAMTIEPIDPVRDQTTAGQDLSPVQAQRAWNRLAEDNVISRLQKAGLLAPDGAVDKVLETVVNNLEITNNLTVQPAVRARVLLTTPLESFTVGNTIVISRGLLDVLPDEATLAAVLAHELAHITLGHSFDTKYAFGDRMIFPDEATLRMFEFHRTKQEEEAADARALTYLHNSPYKDKLGDVGLFLESLRSRRPALTNLIWAHLGTPVAKGKEMRMGTLMSSAPKLEKRRIDQIASLPLGGRIHVDPWSDRIELFKREPVRLTSPKEKMPFELTPVYPYLTLYSDRTPEKAAGEDIGQNQPK